MANTVYEVEEIRLSNGEDIQIRPLTIKNLKKFTEVIKKLNEVEITDESDAMDIFVEAGLICMQQFKPELAQDRDKFEELMEVPTLMRILEVAGGLKMNDPNFAATNLDGQI
jgi:hypothetical protein